MIDLTFDIVTGVAKLVQTTSLKLGADVPVRVTFSAAPGDVGGVQLGLGTDANTPAVLAYTEDFSSESATVYTATLDASDTRLGAFMDGKGPTSVNAELVCILDGVRQVAPNLSITVQPAIITGPTETEGGPVYSTTGEMNTAIAAAIATSVTAQRNAIRIIHTSWTCISDASLAIGTTTFGSDQTAALQAILDEAAAGPILVVWGGAYSCTGLKVRSNTAIQTLPGCGAVLRSAANKPLLANLNRTAGTIVDQNISVQGGIWNGNGFNQSHHTSDEDWITGMNWCGVSGLELRDLQIVAHRTFAVYFTNWKNVSVIGVQTDYGGQTASSFNYDGLHFSTGDNLLVSDCTIRSMDDAIAFTADDVATLQDSTPHESRYYAAGAITAAVVRNVHLLNPSYGVRILSTIHEVEISIDGLTGSASSHAVLIDNYDEAPFYMAPSGEGACRRIEIRRCKLSVGNAAYKDCFVYVGASVEELILADCERTDFSAAIPWLKLSAAANVRTLTVEGFRSLPPTGTTANLAQQILNAGVIRTLNLRGSVFQRGDAGGGSVLTNNGQIGQLNRAAVNLIGYSSLLDGGGTGTVTHDNADASSADALASLWTLDSGITEDVIDERFLSIVGSGSVPVGFRVASDANSGNVQVIARMNFTGSNAGSRTGIVFLRGATPSPWSGTTNYFGIITFGDAQGSPQVYAGKAVSGTFTTLASVAVASNTFLPATEYRIYFRAQTVSGNAVVTAFVQRVSDGLWLNPSAAWVANIGGATACLTFTDSSSPIVGAGKVGAAVLASGTSASVKFTYFTLENLS